MLRQDHTCIGMLACMRLGMPHKAAITLLTIQHGMKYQILTALGITEAHSKAVDWILGTLPARQWGISLHLASYLLSSSHCRTRSTLRIPLTPSNVRNAVKACAP